MMLPFLIIIAALQAVTLLILYFRKNNADAAGQQLRDSLLKMEQGIREELRAGRMEQQQTAGSNREELRQQLLELKQEQHAFTDRTFLQLDKIGQQVDNRLAALAQQAKQDNEQVREKLAGALKEFQSSFEKNVQQFNELQREKFSELENRQTKLVDATERILEEMRATVDEKLQKTLSERLGQSFELVGKQLENVQKGLGEMQTLAQDVGGLKRVLANVKMRGGLGEVQLRMLLENLLSPEQFDENVETKAHSGARVEYAVRFPNKEDEREYVWLPIDAKFPGDAYEALQTAYDAADPVAVEAASKNLEQVIRKMAKDICEKYLDPPNTTNFGIMFLPFEGLFAEVVRRSSLLEELQRSYNVVVTGPTTLASILNGLQMGFRTLAIQKRSSEVWQILAGVKKEFEQFGGLLEKAQKNIQTGMNQLEDVVGKRTKAIQRKLRNVEALEAPGTVETSQPLELEEEA